MHIGCTADKGPLLLMMYLLLSRIRQGLEGLKRAHLGSHGLGLLLGVGHAHEVAVVQLVD